MLPHWRKKERSQVGQLEELDLALEKNMPRSPLPTG